MATETTTTTTATAASSLTPEGQADQLLTFVKGLFGDGWLSLAVTVAAILLFTAVVAHLAVKLVRRLLSHDNSPLPQSSIFVNIVRICVWAIGVAVALSSCFGVDVSAVVTALGIGGIALSLGFQDTISNLIGGLQLSVLGVVEPGDHIEISGYKGVVKDVTWRQTTIETTTDGLVIVPNQVINKTTFVRLPGEEKVVVPISVSKDATDLDTLSERIVAAVAAQVETVSKLQKPPVVLFDSTTEFGYAGSIIVWVDKESEVLKVKDAAVRAIAPFTADLNATGQGADGSAAALGEGVSAT